MPYAIIRTGGKQYKVTEGEILRVEKLVGEVGEAVEFSDVLAVQNEGGLVFEAGSLGSAKVTAQIVRHGRGVKIHILRFARRKGFQKRKGHRQAFTEVRIQSIA